MSQNSEGGSADPAADTFPGFSSVKEKSAA
jgi:hypothetical protein